MKAPVWMVKRRGVGVEGYLVSLTLGENQALFSSRRKDAFGFSVLAEARAYAWFAMGRVVRLVPRKRGGR